MTHKQYIEAITYIMKRLSKKWGVVIQYISKEFIIYHNRKELFRVNDVNDIEQYLKLYLS